MTTHPVAIIGAGPVGLAAAAELATRGRDFVILEAGDAIASSIAAWGHVRLFSPWRFDTAPAARALLTETGWTAPDPDALPTGAELIAEYLAPLAAHPAIAPALRLGVGVTAVARDGIDKVRTTGREHTPFVLRLTDGSELLASAVIDASGTWRTPNPLGGNGLSAPGETEAASRVLDAAEAWLPDGSVIPMPKGIVGAAILNLRADTYEFIPVPSGLPEWTAYRGFLTGTQWLHQDVSKGLRPITPSGRAKPSPRATRKAA